MHTYTNLIDIKDSIKLGGNLFVISVGGGTRPPELCLNTHQNVHHPLAAVSQGIDVGCVVLDLQGYQQ